MDVVENENTSWETISDEIMLMIFGNLSLRDLHKSASPVSKRWLNFSHDFKLQPKVLNMNTKRYPLVILEKYRHVMRNVTWNWPGTYDGRTVRLFTLLEDCPQLRELRLSNARQREGDYQAAIKLEKLLVSLLTVIPTIETLHFDKLRGNYPNEMLVSNQLMDRISSSAVQNLRLRIVKKCALKLSVVPTGLKRLTLFCYDARYVAKAIDYNKIDLIKLKLNLLDYGISVEIKSCKKLKKLTFCFDDKHVQSVSRVDRENILRNATLISELRAPELKLCFDIDDFDLDLSYFVVNSVSNLEVKDVFDGCDSPIFLYLYDRFPRVRKLKFTIVGCDGIPSFVAMNEILKVASRFPKLESLKFKDYVLEDTRLLEYQKFFESTPSLQSLAIISQQPVRELRHRAVPQFEFVYGKYRYPQFPQNKTYYKTTIKRRYRPEHGNAEAVKRLLSIHSLMMKKKKKGKISSDAKCSGGKS